MSTSSSFDYGGSRAQVMHHRSSLPNIPTARSEMPPRTHASEIPRFEPLSYDHKGASHWQASASAYSSRAASVADGQLNMRGLHDSLPSARRLPDPLDLVQHRQSAPCFSWRPQLGIHDRASMSWATEKPESDSRHLNGAQHASSALQPVLGYQFTSPNAYTLEPAPHPSCSTTLRPIQQAELAVDSAIPSFHAATYFVPSPTSTGTPYPAHNVAGENTAQNKQQAYYQPALPHTKQSEYYATPNAAVHFKQPFMLPNMSIEPSIESRRMSYYVPPVATMQATQEPLGQVYDPSAHYNTAELCRHSASTSDETLNLCHFGSSAIYNTGMDHARQTSPRSVVQFGFVDAGHIHAPHAQRFGSAETLQRQASIDQRCASMHMSAIQDGTSTQLT